MIPSILRESCSPVASFMNVGVRGEFSAQGSKKIFTVRDAGDGTMQAVLIVWEGTNFLHHCPQDVFQFVDGESLGIPSVTDHISMSDNGQRKPQSGRIVATSFSKGGAAIR